MRGEEGAPNRDLSGFSKWRADTSPENLELLEMYGSLLIGQYAGMGNALSLDAVMAALRIEGVPRAEWPERSRRLVFLHGLYVEATKDEK